VSKSQHSKLAAVGSRTQASAERFAAEFGVPVAHGSYAALLADPAVQAVYIATPHPQHCEWAIRAAQAGKHILCEKPIGLNHAEAMVIAAAARSELSSWCRLPLAFTPSQAPPAGFGTTPRAAAACLMSAAIRFRSHA